MPRPPLCVINYNTELGNILSCCKGLLSIHTNFEVVFVSRQVNRITHNLATASLSNISPHILYSALMFLLLLDEMK